MNVPPCRTDRGKSFGDGVADFADLGKSKACVLHQRHWSIRAVQSELGAGAIPSHGMDMRRRMIVRVNRYSHASNV
jgi:hypothetical protein